VKSVNGIIIRHEKRSAWRGLKITSRIIYIASGVFALSFWVLDALMDKMVWSEKPFLTLLLFDKEELAFRSLFSLGLLLFGYFSARAFSQQKRIESDLQKELARRRKTEEMLRESENLLQTVIDTVPECIKLTTADGSLMTMNRAGLAMVDAESLDQVKGKSLLPLITPGSREAFKALTEGVFQGKEGRLEFEVVGLKGRHCWLYTHAVPLRNARNDIIALLGVTLDISTQKRTEQEIRKLNRDLRLHTLELENAYKSMESFNHIASHDLRSPLSTIEGFADLLRKEFDGVLDDKGKDYLGRISVNIKKMRQLIDDLLVFSRVSTADIQRSEINMEALTRKVYDELLASAGERNLRLEIKALPSAFGDLPMMRQVLVNLLANSMKFTRPKETAVIEVGGIMGENENIYYVKDNGVGFDMKYADRLFTVPRRLHSQKEFEGTGMGLVIVARIIEKHGGSVRAEATPGAGATFYFTLPRKVA
jgi:PAS domain S-box-containing protein